jgi:predicted dehydrogenase
MLRIAVNGRSADGLHMAAPRLHRALVEFCERVAPEDPVWQSADAVAFLDAELAPPDVVETALSAGKHVLTVTRTGFPEDVLHRLSSVAREQSVLLAVENPDHAVPSRRLIRQQIEADKLGVPGLVRIQRCQPAAGKPPSVGLPAELIGDLETAVRLVGRNPDTVYAVRRIPDSGPPSGECLHVHLGFPGGAMALVSFSTALPPGDGHQSLSVICQTGAAYADGHQNRQLLLAGGPATAPLAEEGDATAFLLEEFVTATENLAAMDERLNCWRRLARLVAAVEESLATHQAFPVEFD